MLLGFGFGWEDWVSFGWFWRKIDALSPCLLLRGSLQWVQVLVESVFGWGKPYKVDPSAESLFCPRPMGFWVDFDFEPV